MIRKAKYHSIPCTFDDESGELQGANWIYDKLVEFNFWLDVNVFMLDEFPLWIEMTDDEIRDYKKKNKL